jgi:hypothetical protein
LHFLSAGTCFQIGVQGACNTTALEVFVGVSPIDMSV